MGLKLKVPEKENVKERERKRNVKKMGRKEWKETDT